MQWAWFICSVSVSLVLVQLSLKKKSKRMAAKLPDKDMNELKKQVLIDRVDYLSGEIGDPGRYFPALRAKGVLSSEDCEKIKAKVTSREKVHEMIELIHKRHSEKDGHAMDVLMEALRKQRVQAHIARELQRALARAIKEQKKEADVKGGPTSPMTPLTTPSSLASSQTLPSNGTPTSSLTTPSNSSVHSLPSAQFEIHPEHGALPPNCPPRKTAQCTPSQLTADPRYGVGPGTPPPRQRPLHPTQEGASSGVGEVAAGMSGLHLSSSAGDISTGAFSAHYHNGRHHTASAQGLDRQNSDLSFTTTSGTVYSTTSTEQSGLDYGRAQVEFREQARGQGEYGENSRGRVREMEAEIEAARSMMMKKDLEISKLKKENTRLNTRLREMEDQHFDLEKQHSQMCEKVRQSSLLEQKQLLESHKSARREEGESDKVVQLYMQLQEKEQQIAELMNQVERYQQDNQQLQLSLSNSGMSSRPHHLPIGTRPPALHRPPSVRSPYQDGVGDTPHPVVMTPSAGITPMRSVRVGDNLSQHNIHLQHSRGSRTQAYSPGKEPASKGPSVFSPGKEGKGLFSPGREGKRLSGGSGDTPLGEGHFQSSNSSLNSSGSKGSVGIMLQTSSSTEHSTMV